MSEKPKPKPDVENLAMMLVHLTSVEEIKTLTEPLNAFSALVHDEAKEAGLTPAELCYALCAILEGYVPEQQQEKVLELGIVAIAKMICRKRNENKNDTV